MWRVPACRKLSVLCGAVLSCNQRSAKASRDAEQATSIEQVFEKGGLLCLTRQCEQLFECLDKENALDHGKGMDS